jgi:predicted porin
MRKKLMAVAVASAVAVPVIAAAQSSVTLSGHARIEYGVGDQGSGNRPDVDYSDSPGAMIRWAGVESLGGGLSAWFQCESTADIRGYDQKGLCSRNSAVGLRGGWGNLFFGKWDTPFKNAMNRGTVGAEETGLLGMSWIPFGGSGSSNATLNVNTAANITLVPAGGGLPAFVARIDGQSENGETAQRQRWKRRDAGLMTYQSPSFGGFTISGAVTPGNAASDNQAQLDSLSGSLGQALGDLTNGLKNLKPRVWSLAAEYVNGPLQIGVGYERHNEFGVVGYIGQNTVTAPGLVRFVPNPADLDDKGFGIGISYGFMGGNVLVGATWLRREWEPIQGADLKKDSWSIGVDWRLAGPHQIQFQYAAAGDSKGSCTAAAQAAHAVALGFTGAAANHNVRCSIGGQGGAAAAGPDTGADSWSIAYQYHFSKRTLFKVGYVRQDNDANANQNRIGNTAGVVNGDNVDSYAFIIRHSF